MLERMGCEGRILTFTDADSPPAWGVLSVMNFGERETSCVKALNWMEADEEYERRMSAVQRSYWIRLKADGYSTTST